MSPFQNRAPRLDLSFPLEFYADGAAIHGHCLNLSESGLLGLFDEPLELWTQGEVLLQAGADSCRLAVRVARVSEREAGVAFFYRGESERKVVRVLLALAVEKTHLVGRPPF